jgi:FkbM family methyltransferase
MANLRIFVDVVKTFRNWPTHLLDYFKLLPPGQIRYRMRNGASFQVRARTLDSMVLREIWIRDDYTPKGFEISQDAIVLDVGGHVGAFAVRAARMAPKGKVYVFEPTSENFSLLRQNIELNHASNVTTFNLALLGHAGSRQMALCDDQVSHSLFGGSPNRKRVEVQGISLSDFMKQEKLSRIDFMKMDCEGAEFEILFECPDEVLARIGKLAAELHDLDEKRNRKTLAEFLRSKGFQVIPDPHKDHMIYAKRPLA